MMPTMDPVFERLRESRVVAVVMIEDEADAVPLARTLLAGGITAMELALRTDGALGSLGQIAAEVPEMMVGAGTILEEEQVSAAQDAGASFGVAPGTNVKILAAAQDAGFPFAPGIATPTDIESALGFGCRVLKFFPAEGMGGLEYLTSIAAPYRHLGLSYIPLGGVNERNLQSYTSSPDILAVGGSWLAPRSLLEAGDWGGIESLARRAVGLAGGGRD